MQVTERQALIKSRRKKRKGARQARVRQQLLRYFLMVLLLGLTAMALSQIKWHLQDPDKDIVVEGNLFTPRKMIVSILARQLYVPVFQIDPRSVELDVKELETVKYAFVRRYVFPHPKVIVRVQEEFPWARVSLSPDLEPRYVITETGRLVPIAKFPDYPKPDLKIYYNPNKSINFDSHDVKQWGTWISYIEQQTGETVKSVDLREKYDSRVATDKTILRLGIADTTLTQRLGRLSSIWNTVEEYRDRLEYIDLALDNNIPLKVSKKSLASLHKNKEKVQEKENTENL